MIQSMTGFGRAEGNYNNKKITIELRSLNSKGLDLNVKMASVYRDNELPLRKYLGDILKRGKIDCSIYFELAEGEKKLSLNKPLIKQYYAELKALSDDLDIKAEDWMSLLVKLPDAMQTERLELDPDEWKYILSLIDVAVNNLQEFRNQEGLSLHDDLSNNINNIAEGLEAVESLLPVRSTKVREKLRAALEELADKTSLDENRFEQELIYYLEKLDISEERTRLRNHLSYFAETMGTPNSEGKKLGFIAQEIGREVNTIGSKANDADIQKRVVGMKDDLEKIKEQVLNVL